MVDTNVLISTILFPEGQAAKCLYKCITKYELVIPSYVIDELKRVVRKKFPDKMQAIDKFFETLSYELAYTPEKIQADLFKIRDPKDYPILYTALIENVDLLISGDKDFKATNVTHPEILSPTEFLQKF